MFPDGHRPHVLEVCRTVYGPLHRPFSGLEARGLSALEAALLDLLAQANTAGAGSLVAAAESHLQDLRRR